MNKKYFNLQLKRIFKIYPTVLLVTFATIISIAVTCVILLSVNASNKQQQKITIGIVGDIHDSYFGIGLNALKSIDSSNFYIDWLELSEDDAKEALKKREISGYINIPQKYVESLFHGENVPAKYVMLNAPEGFGTIVSSEIAEVLSNIVTESQVGMYSMQDFALDYDPKNFQENLNNLMVRYMNFILNRSDIYHTTTLGISDSLSFAGYYICGLLLLFIMLWGISCNTIFTSRNNEYSKILNISGITPYQQVVCEYLAYLVVTLTTLLLFASCFGFVLQYVDLDIPELIGVSVVECILFIIKILPVIIMITLMQVAVYESIPNTVAALMLQFILTIVLGYISGCFYPNYFFPEILQKISYFLPVGAGFSYIRKSMTGLPSLIDFVLVLGYAALFLGLTYFMKKYKVTGDVK